MTATKEQIYSDYLESVIEKYNAEVGNDPNAFEIIKGRLLDKDFDQNLADKFKSQLNRLIEEEAKKNGKDVKP